MNFCYGVYLCKIPSDSSYSKIWTKLDNFLLYTIIWAVYEKRKVLIDCILLTNKLWVYLWKSHNRLDGHIPRPCRLSKQFPCLWDMPGWKEKKMLPHLNNLTTIQQNVEDWGPVSDFKRLLDLQPGGRYHNLNGLLKPRMTLIIAW